MSTKPSTEPQNPRPKKGLRNVFLVALAVLLVGALLIQATVAPLDFGSKDDQKSGSHESLYAGSGGPTEALWSAVPEASVDVQAAIADAHARITILLEEETLAAQAEVEGILASLETLLSLYTGLPAVPVDYVSGLPLHTVPGAVYGYTVPVLETTVALQGVAVPAWQSLPAAIPAHPGVLPGASTQEIEPTLQTLADALGGLQELEELEGVIKTLEDLTGGTPIGGLPVGGLGIPDINGVLEPHEEGAQSALGHADQLLGAADGAFVLLTSQAETVLATQAELVAQIQATLSATQQTVFEAQQDILAEANARGEKTLELLAKQQMQLNAAIESYLTLVDSMIRDAQADIEAIYAGLEADVNAALDRELERLEDLRAQVESDVDAQLRAVVGEAQFLIAELEARGAPDARIQEVLDVLPVVQGQITAKAESALEDIEGAVADLHELSSDVTGDLSAEINSIRRDLDGLARESIAEAHARLDYGLAFVASHAEATIEAQLESADQTIRMLQERAAMESERLISTTTEAVQKVHSGLELGLMLVDGVQAEVFDEVNTDLDYILKVAEDYATAPVPDRQARADYWNAVYGTVYGTLGGVLSTGEDTSSVVVDALALSQSNLVGLASLG